MRTLYPGELRWAAQFDFLKSRGYLLRPRYRPGWVPSWPPEVDISSGWEDALSARVGFDIYLCSADC